MNTRVLKPEDQPLIAVIHAEMGLDYKMPTLAAPMVKAVSVCEENGVIIGASALKFQAETYLWLKPGIAPAEKWDAIRMMMRDLVKQAISLGVEQMVAFVPDTIEKSFFKRLIKLGFVRQRDGWRAWSFEVSK